jgi:hypothetical protein
MAIKFCILLLVPILSQYAYHSKSPYGPWAPIKIKTPKGVNFPEGAIWFGPYCRYPSSNASKLMPLNCGGNNPSPYLVDSEASAMTGYSPGTVIIATTWSANYSYDGETMRRRGSIVVGIAKNWTMPVDLNPTSLFHLPLQNEWANFTNVSGQDVWRGWGYEDPLVYFDKRIKRWRAMFHMYRKSGLADHGSKGTWPAKGASDDPNIMSGGYAISNSSSLFGGWTVYSPGFGAGYSKVVNFTATAGSSPQGWPVVVPAQAEPPPPRPYQFGTPAATGGYRNDTLPTCKCSHLLWRIVDLSASFVCHISFYSKCPLCRLNH